MSATSQMTHHSKHPVCTGKMEDWLRQCCEELPKLCHDKHITNMEIEVDLIPKDRNHSGKLTAQAFGLYIYGEKNKSLVDHIKLRSGKEKIN